MEVLSLKILQKVIYFLILFSPVQNGGCGVSQVTSGKSHDYCIITHTATLAAQQFQNKSRQRSCSMSEGLKILQRSDSSTTCSTLATQGSLSSATCSALAAQPSHSSATCTLLLCSTAGACTVHMVWPSHFLCYAVNWFHTFIWDQFQVNAL